MLAIVCPGQGSQTPGFLTEWLDVVGVRDHLSDLGDLTGRDLIAHGTVSDEETIKDTAIAQPLIVAAGLATARALFDDQLPPNTVRYRLKRVSEVTGWDPLVPRDAFVLQMALMIGRLR